MAKKSSINPSCPHRSDQTHYPFRFRGTCAHLKLNSPSLLCPLYFFLPHVYRLHLFPSHPHIVLNNPSHLSSTEKREATTLRITSFQITVVMSQRPGTHVPSVRAETEKSLGITQRSAAINFAWTGDIRKRYAPPLFAPVTFFLYLIADLLYPVIPTSLCSKLPRMEPSCISVILKRMRRWLPSKLRFVVSSVSRLR